MDWEDVLSEINDKIAPPLSLDDALDAIEELISELEVTADALKDDIRRRDEGE